MAKLFQNKIDNTKVELSIGTVYVKPLPMKLLSIAEKLGNEGTNAVEQVIAFAMIMKTVLVDEKGNELDDVKEMTAEELGDAFPVADFTILIQAILPQAPAAGN